MEKQNKTQLFIIAILAVALLTMAVGFAAFSQNLEIAGNASVSSASWSVLFNTTSYAETSGSTAATAHDVTGTTASFTVTLAKPGDFYEFTVDVNNCGTFDAKLTSITMTALTEAQQKYLTYTVTYAGTDYTASATGLSDTISAKSGSTCTSKTAKVKVEYIQPENASDLPTATVTVPLSATLHFDQA